MSEGNGHCPGFALSATRYTRPSVEAYLAVVLAERDRILQRLEEAKQRRAEAEALLVRLDALSGGAASPRRRSGEKVCADG